MLDDAARTRDATSVATVLGALAPLFQTLPESIAEIRSETGTHLERITGWTNRRGVAGVVWQHLERTLVGVSRCPADQPCPACRLGEPCPRDTWTASLADFVLPEPDEPSVVAFWNPRGQSSDERGKGAGRGWAAMRAVAPPLADATLRRCLDFYRAERQPERATDVADQVWREGCRDPAIAALHAMTTAAGGRISDIEAAIGECRQVLARRLGNTERAWDHLAVVAAMLDGRLARELVPSSARHIAHNPVRAARAPRFLRRAVVA